MDDDDSSEGNNEDNNSVDKEMDNNEDILVDNRRGLESPRVLVPECSLKLEESKLVLFFLNN